MAACIAAPVLAHHSRANFDFEQEVDFTGTIKEFSWRNPHAYLVIEGPGADGQMEQRTFEMNSTPILMRYGWKRDSVAVGDEVVIRANPDRDAAKKFYYTTVVVKEDGTELWSWGEGAQAAPPAPVPPSTDLTGVWRFAPEGGFNPLGLDRPDDVLRTTDLPINEAGEAMLAAFDMNDDPSLNCQEPTLPGAAGAPYPNRITRLDENTLEIAYEVDNARRTVHLNMDEHPADLAPSPLGHSIGAYQPDGSLVIDTVGFTPATWGHDQAIDSSDQKHVVERLELLDGGRRYRNTITVTDPAMLTDSYTRVYTYAQNGNYELQDYTCDVETARRHLTAGEE
jgi:hypothetical protein